MADQNIQAGSPSGQMDGQVSGRTAADAIISVRHLSKSFGKHEVLKDIDFNVFKGDVTTVIGASGSGKSTLLRCINLLETPSSGQILYHGQDVMGRHVDAAGYRSHVGMVFQSFNLFYNKNVLDNCMVGQIRVLKRSKQQAYEEAIKYLGKVGMLPYVKAKPRQLSGGQKQRVAIARALANNPQILLCDEATSALDLETTEEILALLKRINAELGITIVFITHQLDVAKQIFDHVAVMEDGQIVEQGETFDVFSAPKHPTTKSLVDRYLGIAIPPQLVPSLPAGTIVELRYRGDGALEPLISDVTRQYGVSINVLHGDVEYFGPKPIGTLIVLVDGPAETLAAALNTLKTHVYSYRELDRKQLAQPARGDGQQGEE